MAKRRRNRVRRAPVAQNENQAVRMAEDNYADDGFINTLAYLGEASALSKANGYERHPLSENYELLTVLYRENWLAARIIDTPCEDMTRSWYSLASEIEQEKLDELAKLEAKHNVKQELTNGLRWARLYGGAAAIMVIKGQEDMLDQPLDYDMIMPGSFRGLIIVDRFRGIFPSIEIEEDMDDPDFGYPMYYDVNIDVESGALLRVHHSRILIFRGRMLPIDEEINENYWGAPELEHIYEELQKRNATSANVAQLVFQANVAALKMSDYGEALAMGTKRQREQLYRYIEEMNRLRTSFGITLMNADDSYEQHPYSFTGVAEVYETFMMDMAGAAEIPATKLFGRAPQGMNATGESDMKNYYEIIAQLQERHLRPALEKLLPVMCMSLWGDVPDDLEIVFEPLGTTTPSERAEIMGKFSSPIIQAYTSGVITQRMALQELRETGKPINAWTNITDEDVEKASDEFDGGEGDMGGMEGMMPGMGQEGGEMPPQMPGGQNPQPEQEAPEKPVQDETGAFKENLLSMAKAGDIDGARKLLDEYRAKHGKPVEKEPEKPQQDEETRLNEALSRAKAIIAEKKEPQKERKGFLHDLAVSIRRIFDRDFVESEHPRGKGGKFVSKNGGSGIGNSPQTEYNSVKGWKGIKATMEVGGPKAARKYIADYISQHPEIKAEIPKYMDVRDKVLNFTKRFPNAENFNTYDALTGEKKDIQNGFCVTFHQNLDPKDTLGGYSDEDYAAMCAIAVRELGSDTVNIGYYGNPEVSFECKDEKAAKEFAIKHNQKSVYNAKTGKTLMNKKYNPELNPIENA